MTDRTTPSINESLVSTTTLDHVGGLAQFTLIFAGIVLFVGTAAAQSQGEAFCNTDMDQTIQNIYTLIQFGGPLLGGLVALGDGAPEVQVIPSLIRRVLERGSRPDTCRDKSGPFPVSEFLPRVRGWSSPSRRRCSPAP